MFRTYEIPGVFEELDPQQPVLRYFNLVKFFDLIETRSLYFADPISLNDEMEGEVGLHNHRHRPEVYADTPGLLEQLAEVDRLAKRYALISSWSIGNDEDFLMSSTYGTPPPCIVVHTTWGNLRQSLRGEIPIYGAQCDTQIFTTIGSAKTPYFGGICISELGLKARKSFGWLSPRQLIH